MEKIQPRRISRTTHRSTDVGAVVSARTISRVRRADTSRQVDLDQAIGALGSNIPIDPPYRFSSLSKILDQSNMLRQCIAAYVTNIAMNGWEIVAAVAGVDMDKEEVSVLQSFIDSPNADETLRSIQAKNVYLYEGYGHSYVEVVRDRKGNPTIIRNVPTTSIGICPKGEALVAVKYDIIRGPRAAQVTEMKRFRIFRQDISGHVVFFKEFGDPRRLDFVTGAFESDTYKVGEDRLATELIHFRQMSDDPYGTPRWINQLPSILGSREAEEVNFRYFQDNTVPPMILSVAGGRLTGQSFRELKSLLQAENVGKERQNQILLLEAVPEREGLEDKGTPITLKIDKLTDVRPSDALFTQYDEANQAKVRSSFRLPPVSVGLSQDITFATANVSTFVVETQVFGPERTAYDEVWNKRFVQHPLGLNLKTVALRSKAPVVTNPEILIRSLTALNVMGAVTPRLAREAANNILQIEMPPYPEKDAEGYEPWMDEPIIFAVKAGSGNEGIDPSNTGDTHASQSQKDAGVKSVEGTGDVSQKPPEHGSE